MSEIRRARFDDLAEIEAVVAEAFAPYVARMGRRPAPMDDDHRARIAAGEVEVWVDEAGIGGVLVFDVAADPAHLDTVAVADRLRGRGIGRRLVAHAEAVARAAGRRKITLFTHVTMVENLAIYPHLGWVETHRARQDGFDRVFFAKSLGDDAMGEGDRGG